MLNKSVNKNMKKSVNKSVNKSVKRWSNKYKKSINCSNPRGFSQKQYCKYGRNRGKSKTVKNKPFAK